MFDDAFPPGLPHPAGESGIVPDLPGRFDDFADLLREIAGLYVLIPAGETDAPQNRITALNETGRFLWMQFQHPCTVAEAAAAAEAQYTGQPAEMLRGIENFVRAGLRAGLLREASAAEKTEGKAV